MMTDKELIESAQNFIKEMLAGTGIHYVLTLLSAGNPGTTADLAYNIHPDKIIELLETQLDLMKKEKEKNE